jgi:hypothetical protein
MRTSLRRGALATDNGDDGKTVGDSRTVGSAA